MPRLSPILLLAALVSASGAKEVPLPKCGTPQAAQRYLTGNPAVFPRVSAARPSARTLSTAHFSLHYSLAPDVHRVLLTAGDSSLRRQADSVYASLPASWAKSRRDSALHAALNALGSPHPGYVLRAAEYFELAWAHYVDSLGMIAPPASGQNEFFEVPDDTARFTVNIADVGTMDPLYRNDIIYGLTYPPYPPASFAHILIENDFLYQAAWHEPAQTVIGSPVRAVVNGQTYRDYTVEWDFGLKVTAVHEFYHGIQYGYTGVPSGGYHAWYELSAAGMEERLAPEVNDYFQYLSPVFSRHEQLSLLAAGGVSNYGNGIFHQYLTRKLGPGFDVKIWSNLRGGADLAAALSGMAAASGARWDTLYAGYAAALAAAGRTGSASGCEDAAGPIFDRDLPCWPQAQTDSLPTLGNSKTLTAPPLTFRLLRPPSVGVGIVSLTGLNGPRRVEKTASGYSVTDLTGNPFQLFPSPGGSVLAWSVPNASFVQSGEIRLSTRSQNFAAYPNPAVRTQSEIFFFPAPGVSGAPLLTLVSKSGRRVAEIPFDSARYSWNWNLKDAGGKTVPPGAYYYRVPGQGAKSLLILP